MLIYYISMRVKDEKKYESILNASMEHFMSDGFANASIAKIAKTAGVSPATIYIHFENKEDLISKLYLKIRKEMSEYVLVDVDLEGCIEAAYKKIWQNYYHYCLTYHREFDYIMQFTNSPFSKDYHADYGMCYFSKIYELFDKGKKGKVIKDISDEILFAFTFYPASQLAKRNICCGSKLCDYGVNKACDVAWDAVKMEQVKICYNQK
ncbi:TetR/AcrR family transcriptional regulator [Fusibacter ferrireducens]|nr:TetR/AcrR family transcriptional regulator [Fusibacter ferrireducens]